MTTTKEQLNKLRELAAAIKIKAIIGSGPHKKPGFETVERRLELIALDAQKILEMSMALYPDQPVLTPAEGLKFFDHVPTAEELEAKTLSGPCNTFREDPAICDDIGEPKGQCECGYNEREHLCPH